MNGLNFLYGTPLDIAPIPSASSMSRCENEEKNERNYKGNVRSVAFPMIIPDIVLVLFQLLASPFLSINQLLVLQMAVNPILGSYSILA